MEPDERPTFNDTVVMCGRIFHEDEESEFYYGSLREAGASDDIYDIVNR
jgi:hypothetical protein